MLAFANFGFPESHSISFASLVYYSAWFKLYHPAAFCAALLNAQPMGFYSPQSLVADARRHGVVAVGPDVNSGRAEAILFRDGRSKDGLAIRLGLAEVRTIGLDLAEAIDAERERGGPFSGPRRPRRSRAAHVGAGRGAGHGGGVRLLRDRPARGAVGGRGGGVGARGAPAGHGRRAGGPRAAGAHRPRS